MHRVLLGGFGLALIVSFLPLIRLSLPTRQEALRRLERTAGIKHRPASSYEDRLGTTPPKETAALWAAHRERLGKLIGRLKPSWPAPRTDRKDPYAIRAALLLAVVAAFLATGGKCSIGCAPPSRPPHPAHPRCSGSMPGLRLRSIPASRRSCWPTATRRWAPGLKSFRALSVPERSELIVRTHAPQGETVSLVTSRDGAEGKTIEPKQGRQRRAWSSSTSR